MSVPFLVDSKRATTNEVIVEVSRSQVPPMLPFELRGYVTPTSWENRMSILARLASQHCRPTFERVYLVVIMVLTLLVPITTYYVTLQSLENTTNNVDEQVWSARFTCFAAMIALWLVLFAPVVIWKYLGKVRVTELTGRWTRADALSAPSYGAAPVWKASTPGLFRNHTVLTVTVPSTTKSNFDRDGCLPLYIAAADDVLPSYSDSKMTRWSKDPKGGIKYGELPIYTGIV